MTEDNHISETNKRLSELVNIANYWKQIGESLNITLSKNNLSSLGLQINTAIGEYRRFEKLFDQNDFLNKISLTSLKISEALKPLGLSIFHENNNIVEIGKTISNNLSLLGSYNGLTNLNSNLSFKIEEISKQVNECNFFNKSNISDISKSLDVLVNKNSFLNNNSSFSELLKALEANFYNFSIDKTTIAEIEAQDIVLNEQENKIIKEMLETLIDIVPHLSAFIKSLKEKKYHKTVIFIVIYFIEFITVYATLSQFFSTDVFYKINRNNVRIRETPSKEYKHVICKLNKNITVEKIDSKNGWAKVRFEQEEGVEKEGWVYGNMLSKVE